MTNPLFSILIAQYNNGKYFQDCYKSIMAQIYDHWEVIIVDDGSTDDSVAVMKEIIGNDARFKIEINSENKGCGFTKRKCAELATGEICAFLDPDDVITPDALSVMVDEHAKHPEASMIYSKPFWCDEYLNIQSERKSQQVENGVSDFFDLDGYLFAFLSYKNDFYHKTEGINSYLQRAIDKDLVLKLYETGPAFLKDKAMYKYRIHPNGISTNRNQDKAYFWYWVTIMDAAKRRNLNIEDLFIEKALQSRREVSLEKEIAAYNKSIIFKVLRKLGLFKLFVN
ncbi:glycosyltransferase [Chryseobacterium salivictor]|uniref:Chondroitin synthase n=1 Tax=Chryseobacterium salivictor TaxID=2547600 RepID=A0A4P6ZFP7_9FLAO|nr:glycosyltransferase [Chryseobacterium salivictor]QBO58355.1 Chondroitin synthase [Chryseobacterium salivictor]